MPEKIDLEEIKKYKFYWTPPKNSYDKDPSDEFFEQEFTFVFDIGNPAAIKKGSFTPLEKTGLVVTSNALDNKEKVGIKYESDSLESAFRGDYYFETNQDSVPNSAKRAVLVFLLNNKDPLRTRIKEL